MKRHNLRNWLLMTCKIDGIIEIGLGNTIYFWPWKSLYKGYSTENHIVVKANDFRTGLGIQKLTNKVIRAYAAKMLREASR